MIFNSRRSIMEKYTNMVEASVNALLPFPSDGERDIAYLRKQSAERREEIAALKSTIIDIQNAVPDDWADYGSTIPTNLISKILSAAILTTKGEG